MELAQQDHFDRLPDALLLLIFNKVLDIKALSRCLSVCKRFSSLIPQTNTLFVAIPPCIPTSKPASGLCLASLRIFLKGVFTKPLKHFRRIVTLESPSGKSSNFQHSFNNALKKFEDVKFIHIQFPFYGSGIDLVGGDCLVKWKAEFGGQLKVRIIWTISCLIAASARHHFLKKILLDHPSLESVVISDEKKQGKLCMGPKELAEIRGCMESSTPSKPSLIGRTRVPDLSVKLSYATELVLPASGYRMRGATLMVIRPVDGEFTRKEISDVEFLESGFDGEHGEDKVFAEAVREMTKMKKSYVMTMNSF
ncbi:F-box protein At4g18380-like [Mangifera indica]|uniref:F-box protein At4g18380-like n=1 Tax=Mangifera indica TaxID=29780 RepID=UPI001CFA6178|nr:F-box protein At4g18380-like [Mangifera indica]